MAAAATNGASRDPSHTPHAEGAAELELSHMNDDHMPPEDELEGWDAAGEDVLEGDLLGVLAASYFLPPLGSVVTPGQLWHTSTTPSSTQRVMGVGRGCYEVR